MARVTQEHKATNHGKGMDLSFLGKPHEHDPRRTYSTTATDWQARVDFDRLRRDRLARARMMMEKHDLGALVCFVGRERPLHHFGLPGQLEEQHLHPLLRASAVEATPSSSRPRAPTSSAPRSTRPG